MGWEAVKKEFLRPFLFKQVLIFNTTETGSHGQKRAALFLYEAGAYMLGAGWGGDIQRVLDHKVSFSFYS